ncbi:DUF4148 domain-containing protein [Paraburkholderia sp. A2WS-5]|uniref:DUF4148 domain-containing protein n=1 Tax=unclassified Paraburkholderia TaxID=2615204 RepID=UPI003B81CA9B
MKTLIQAIAVASALAVPALSFAAQTQPLTRAQVRNEYVQLKQAGYEATDYNYEASMRAAEAKLAHQSEAPAH